MEPGGFEVGPGSHWTRLKVHTMWFMLISWAVFLNFSSGYDLTRYLPGDALVLKLKYNLEKRSKWQYWNVFQRALKLWEITASFYFSLLETSGKKPVHYWLLPVHGAMNHSGTPLWLMLRSPSFYQGANCQVWSSTLDNTWSQRPNQRLPFKLVDTEHTGWNAPHF